MQNKIIENAEKIKKMDMSTNRFEVDVFKIINHVLCNMFNLLKNDFKVDYFLTFEDIFNFAVRKNLLHPVDQDDYQVFIVEKKCDIYDLEEAEKRCRY